MSIMGSLTYQPNSFFLTSDWIFRHIFQLAWISIPESAKADFPSLAMSPEIHLPISLLTSLFKILPNKKNSKKITQKDRYQCHRIFTCLFLSMFSPRGTVSSNMLNLLFYLQLNLTVTLVKSSYKLCISNIIICMIMIA